MKTIHVTILALLLVVGLSACSDRAEADRGDGYALADDQNFLTDAEKQFVLYASEMHVGEIALAEQAKQKSSNEGITKHADAVIKTHKDALEDLSDRTKGIAEPSKVASSDTKGHAEYLATLSGAQFDKEFVDLMIADHKSAVETFKAESAIAQNSDLKAYMKGAISSLQDRWDEGSELQKKVTSKVSQR
jgi:putative membrane protein